ncbi:hypothetical protein RI367_004184 [Sorochytrium milnesiophthora]
MLLLLMPLLLLPPLALPALALAVPRLPTSPPSLLAPPLHMTVSSTAQQQQKQQQHGKATTDSAQDIARLHESAKDKNSKHKKSRHHHRLRHRHRCHWIPAVDFQAVAGTTDLLLLPPAALNDRFYFDPIARECTSSAVTDAPFESARHCEQAECKHLVNPCNFNVCEDNSTCVWDPFISCVHEPCADFVCEPVDS